MPAVKAFSFLTNRLKLGSSIFDIIHFIQNLIDYRAELCDDVKRTMRLQFSTLSTFAFLTLGYQKAWSQ